MHPDDYHGSPKVELDKSEVYTKEELKDFYEEAGYSAWSYRHEEDEGWDSNWENEELTLKEFDNYGNSILYQYIFVLYYKSNLDIENFIESFEGEIDQEMYDGSEVFIDSLADSVLDQEEKIEKLIAISTNRELDSFIISYKTFPKNVSSKIERLIAKRYFSKHIYGTIEDLDRIEGELTSLLNSKIVRESLLL